MSLARVLLDAARSSRGRRTPGGRSEAAAVPVIEPEQGWLDMDRDGVVELAAKPAAALAPHIGLLAATACAERQPGAHLRDWLAASRERPVWDDALRRAFFALLHDGNERSWRLLRETGMLGRLLPDLAARFRASESAAEAYGALAAVVAADAPHAWGFVSRPHLVLLAALLRDVFPADPRGGARRVAAHIGLGPHDVEFVSFLVVEQDLLSGASARAPSASEDQALDVAVYVGDVERAAALYLLARTVPQPGPGAHERLDALYATVVEALMHPDLVGPSARDLVLRRVAEVSALAGEIPEHEVRRHLMAAPRRYLLAQPPATAARHVRMIETKPGRFEVRLEAEPLTHDSWLVHVATLDRRGVLAGIAGSFVAHQVSVIDAHISTWRTGVAIDVFRVQAPYGTDWERVRRTIEARLAHGEQLASLEPIDGAITIDNSASPWHSILEIRTRDRAGLLHRVAGAMARADISIHQASVATRGDVAVDAFWVTGPRGTKLDDSSERRLRAAFSGKPYRKWRAIRALREWRGAETRL